MIGSPYVLKDADCSAGIQVLAQRLLGDQSLWTQIVQINTLRPPYLTLDPYTAYGQPLGKESLPAAVTVGNNAISLPNAPAQLWITGNNAVFLTSGATGLTVESQIIQSYDGTTLTLAVPLQNSYPQGATVSVYSRQVFNAGILLPGNVVYLPVTQNNANPNNSFVMSTNGTFTDVFGSDATGPLQWANGDIATVQGVATLIQRIKAVILTSRNTLPQYPAFGSRIGLAIGAPAKSLEWAAYIREAILQLPEVQDMTDLVTTVQGDMVYLTGKVWVYTSKIPLILQNEALTLPVFQ